MTQHTTKNGIPLLLDFPEHEIKAISFHQPSYVKACQGNECMASVLDYFVYVASCEAKEQGLARECTSVTFRRTHAQILAGIKGKKPSRSALIHYIAQLDAWGMVSSEPYQREYTAHLDVIQHAFLHPPTEKLPYRKPKREQNWSVPEAPDDESQWLHEKVCNVTTLHTLAETVERLTQLVASLEEKVVTLQQKVATLQPKEYDVATFLSNIQTLQHRINALETRVSDANSAPPITSLYNLPLDTIKDSCVIASADDAPLPRLFREMAERVFALEAIQGAILEENAALKADLVAMQQRLCESLPPHQGMEQGGRRADASSYSQEATTHTTHSEQPALLDPDEQKTGRERPCGKGKGTGTSKGRGKGKTGGNVIDFPHTDDQEVEDEAAKEYARRRRYWQAEINTARGGPLRKAYACINESKALGRLVREFDDYQIRAIWTYLAKEHWKFKRNPREIGGVDLLDHSSPSWQEIKDRPEHRSYRPGTSSPEQEGAQVRAPVIASTPGSQAIVEVVERTYEENFRAWYASQSEEDLLAMGVL